MDLAKVLAFSFVFLIFILIVIDTILFPHIFKIHYIHHHAGTSIKINIAKLYSCECNESACTCYNLLLKNMREK